MTWTLKELIHFLWSFYENMFCVDLYLEQIMWLYVHFILATQHKLGDESLSTNGWVCMKYAIYKQWETSKILILKYVLQYAELHYSDVQLTQ